MGEYSSGDYIPSLSSSPNAAGNLVKNALPSDYMPLTLGGSSGAWTFQDSSDRYLNRTGDKKLRMGAESTSTWTIAISAAGVATITTEEQSIKYNSSSPRFSVYTSGQTDVSIYMIPSTDPYIEVAVVGSTSLGVGESATLNVTKLNGASGTVNWATSNSSALSLSASTGDSVTVTAGSVLGEATITASLEGCDDFETVFKVRNGSLSSPYTVAEARAAIDAGADITNVYATGIVSQIVTPYSSQYGNISYNISDDGEPTSDQLEAYRGKSFNGEDFTDADDIQVGAIVVICGNLTKFSSTYEFAEGNFLVSYTLPTKYTVTFVTNGSTVNPQTITEGDTVAQPDDPTRDTDGTYRYTFIAWYDNPEFNGDPYDFDTPVTGPLTLYAKWEQALISAKEIIESTLSTKSSLSYTDYQKQGNGAVDALDKAFTGVGNSYGEWENKTGDSGVVYAGQSAGGNDSIQLRSNNSNSGVIVTDNNTGNFARKITVSWNSNTENGRTINVYGKDSAYSEATELYSTDTQGTLIGTIVCGTSTELEIDGDYEFIGFRSASGALYLDSVNIQWGNLPTFAFTNLAVRFKGQITQSLWNRLEEESDITGYGILFTANGFTNLKEWYDSSVSYTSNPDPKSEIVNYTNVKDLPNLTGDIYGWSLRYAVSDADYKTTFTAVAYIVTDTNGVVFMEEESASVKDLAAGLIADGTYQASEFGGSLNWLATL